MTKTYDELCSDVSGIVTEEAAEVIQILSKIHRFGLYSDYQGKTNQQLLEGEIGDLLAGISLLANLGIIDYSSLRNHMNDKFERLKKWSPDLERQCDSCLYTNILNFNQNVGIG